MYRNPINKSVLFDYQPTRGAGGARHKFDEALKNDRPRAEMALAYIQALYVLERKAIEAGLTASQQRTAPGKGPAGVQRHEQMDQQTSRTGASKIADEQGPLWEPANK